MPQPFLIMSGPAAAIRDSAGEPGSDAGLGALRTARGNLPLDRIDLAVDIVGLTSGIRLTQEFVNVHPEPLEATYIFPLPARAAVTGMRLEAAGREITAELAERGAAREAYDQAIASGRRAAIAEEERPDVFTLRVGNILSGERVTVTLALAGVLALADGEAEFRFPLVVAPRYIPGAPLAGPAVGAGYADDTDAVPDASRITPPVLLPGFPNPVRLSIELRVDPAGLPLRSGRCNLPATVDPDGRIRVHTGQRANQDLIVRFDYGGFRPEPAGDTAGPASGGLREPASLVVVPDPAGEESTFQLTVFPPALPRAAKPRDVVLLLDRSGSMDGWKIVAARRATARIIDTLGDQDRFAVLAFDSVVETPDDLPSGLVTATDRHRYLAVEFLAKMGARGGTELLEPLRRAVALLAGAAGPGAGAGSTPTDRERVLVLVTDGQVGDEDRILRETPGLGEIRVHTVGIDQAVNAGFLGRLASLGGGRCELVESEDRLDEAMGRIHRRIGAAAVTGVRLSACGLTLIDGMATPDRLPDLFSGVPYVVKGRIAGTGIGDGTITLRGTTRTGEQWSATAHARQSDVTAVTTTWARAILRDLEDRYVALDPRAGWQRREELERRIVELSLRFGVLCRFTAYLAVDSAIITDGNQPRQLVQPVEYPAGWPAPSAAAAPASLAAVPVAGSPLRARTARRGAAPAAAPAALAGTGVQAMRAAGAAFGVPDRDLPVTAADVRAFAVTEARRLRDAESEPDYRRWELLEDLESRVGALTHASSGKLAALAALLKAERHSAKALEQLWRAVLAMLDQLAGESSQGRAPSRRVFWKR